MLDIKQEIIIFVSAIITTVIGTRFFCIFAQKINLVDKPDQMRRLQKQAIPVGGGSVVYLIVSLFTLGTALLYGPPPASLRIYFLCLFLVATLFVIIGLYDDRKEMSGKTKLLAQVIAVLIFLKWSTLNSPVSFWDEHFRLHYLFYPVAIFCFAGLINALNLLDGADGVAASLGIYVVTTLGIIAHYNGWPEIAGFCFLLAASLFGFFLCNMPPAKVYLGDTGSMLIAFVIGAIYIKICQKPDTREIPLIPGFCLVCIPILDSLCAIIRRLNSRRSIAAADRSHIHHRIQRLIGKDYILLATLAFFQILCCVAAALGIIRKNDWIPLITTLVIWGLLAITGIFGRAEIIIICRRILYAFRIRYNRKRYDRAGLIFRAQGHRDWGTLWLEALREAQKDEYIYLTLDINIPFAGEDFYAEWKGSDKKCPYASIINIPLIGDDQRRLGVMKIKFNQLKIDYRQSAEAAWNLHNKCVDYIQEKLRESGV